MIFEKPYSSIILIAICVFIIATALLFDLFNLHCSSTKEGLVDTVPIARTTNGLLLNGFYRVDDEMMAITPYGFKTDPSNETYIIPVTKVGYSMLQPRYYPALPEPGQPRRGERPHRPRRGAAQLHDPARRAGRHERGRDGRGGGGRSGDRGGLRLRASGQEGGAAHAGGRLAGAQAAHELLCPSPAAHRAANGGARTGLGRKRHRLASLGVARVIGLSGVAQLACVAQRGAVVLFCAKHAD